MSTALGGVAASARHPRLPRARLAAPLHLAPRLVRPRQRRPLRRLSLRREEALWVCRQVGVDRILFGSPGPCPPHLCTMRPRACASRHSSASTAPSKPSSVPRQCRGPLPLVKATAEGGLSALCGPGPHASTPAAGPDASSSLALLLSAARGRARLRPWEGFRCRRPPGAGAACTLASPVGRSPGCDASAPGSISRGPRCPSPRERSRAAAGCQAGRCAAAPVAACPTLTLRPSPSTSAWQPLVEAWCMPSRVRGDEGPRRARCRPRRRRPKSVTPETLARKVSPAAA